MSFFSFLFRARSLPLSVSLSPFSLFLRFFPHPRPAVDPVHSPDKVLGRDPGLPDGGAEQRRAGDEDAPVEFLKWSAFFFFFEVEVDMKKLGVE